MKNIHKGHRERLFDKYINNGPDSFMDHELLELLIMFSRPRVDTNPIAHELLDYFGSMNNVLNAHPSDLMSVNGVGKKTALLISLINDIQKRAVLNDMSGKSLDTSDAAIAYCMKLFEGAKRELVYVLCLNSSNKLISQSLIAKGTDNSVVINVRDVVEASIRNSASAVIVAHNHTSDDVIPSDEDVETTKNIVNALQAIEVKLNDNIIVGKNRALSMMRDKVYEFRRVSPIDPSKKY